MENIINWAIGLVVLIVLVSGVIMTTIINTNTTGWDTGTVLLWGVAEIVVIAVVIATIARAARG